MPENGEIAPFYGERSDFNVSQCSDFVKQIVLPQLGKKPECIYSMDGLREAVAKWLLRFKHMQPVVCYGYSGDWELLYNLLSREVSDWLKCQNVQHLIDEIQFKYFMETLFNNAEHHALHDAICNKLAYRAG